VLSQLTGALVDTIVEGSGLTSREFAVASWLALVQPATPSDLAADLGLAPTTLSALIERLVRKRQVRRVRNPDDGRSYLLELTARGVETNARNGRRFREVMGRLRANLEGDHEEILGQMRLLEDAMRRTLAQ
jgi:DNA-binding MarR family transcriptional regulator